MNHERSRSTPCTRRQTMRALVTSIAATLFASISMPVHAAADVLPQSAPHFATGDTWTYAWTDELSGKRRIFTQTVKDVHADGSAIVSLGTGGKTLLLSAEGNVIAAACGPQDIRLHFPLASGATYSSQCEAHDSWGNWTRRTTGEVKGVETVQTKAGAFVTVKVELTGTWWLASGPGGGRFDETLWYAPAVKRFVKDEYQARPSGKGVPTTTETELVRYAVKQ